MGEVECEVSGNEFNINQWVTASRPNRGVLIFFLILGIMEVVITQGYKVLRVC